jgi:hypothetical protein
MIYSSVRWYWGIGDQGRGAKDSAMESFWHYATLFEQAAPPRFKVLTPALPGFRASLLSLMMKVIVLFGRIL